jgi:hypothetical protein
MGYPGRLRGQVVAPAGFLGALLWTLVTFLRAEALLADILSVLVKNYVVVNK